jgi:hypothetical protein
MINKSKNKQAVENTVRKITTNEHYEHENVEELTVYSNIKMSSKETIWNESTRLTDCLEQNNGKCMTADWMAEEQGHLHPTRI